MRKKGGKKAKKQTKKKNPTSLQNQKMLKRPHYPSVSFLAVCALPLRVVERKTGKERREKQDVAGETRNSISVFSLCLMRIEGKSLNVPPSDAAFKKNITLCKKKQKNPQIFPTLPLGLCIWFRADRKHLEKRRQNLMSDWANLVSVTFKRTSRTLCRASLRLAAAVLK